MVDLLNEIIHLKILAERKVYINGIFLEQGQKTIPTLTNLMHPVTPTDELNLDILKM